MISSLTSIRSKTSLLFFILFVGIILPVNWIIYRKIKSVLEEANKREMMWEAEKLLSQVKLDPLIIPLSGQYDLQLLFKGKMHDEVIFSSPDFPALPPETFLLDYFSHDTLEIVNITRETAAASGELLLSLSRNNFALGQRLNEVQVYLFLINAAALALAAILVYLAAGWMLRPIHQISQAATRIQASQSIERVPVPHTRDESHSLAESINAMLDRIELTIKNQTNFFASATHELKTPLAVMKAELTITNENHKWEGLLAEVERLEHVIGDFLLISQLKSDSLIIRKKYESAEELIYKALHKVNYLNGQFQTNIRITLSEENTDYLALVDAEKLETVFINLLENAVRYSHPKNLDIFIGAATNYLQIDITNPVNESIKDIDLLKQEFKKSREFSAGLGMGLWISDQILKLHGGSLVLTCHDLKFIARVTLPKN